MNYGNIDEFMAANLPNVPFSWLLQLNEKLGWIKQNQSGNADMHVHWSGGIDQYTEWTFRMVGSKAKI